MGLLKALGISGKSVAKELVKGLIESANSANEAVNDAASQVAKGAGDYAAGKEDTSSAWKQ
jgi:hypothetical protein